MKKFWMVFAVMMFISVPFTALALEGPMNLPAGSDAKAVSHNKEGIDHWGQGHYDVALKHFQASAKIDAANGEIHFNEAICLDKLGKHGEATMHFKSAKKSANGNESILNSPILNGHIGG